MKFILDLQKREEAAFPDQRRPPSSRSVEADERAADVLRQVDEKGLENMPWMRFVMEAIERRNQREAVDPYPEFDMFPNSWDFSDPPENV